MLRDYARLITFACGLLVGVQVPGFVDQYAKRVSAHYIEAQRSFSGFRATADQFFNGSVAALIAHHRLSGDRVFIDEAKTIQGLQDRLAALAAEATALQGSLVRQIVHVAVAADPEILSETTAAYSYTVPLAPAAIICGVTIGFAFALLVEALLLGALRLVGLAGRRTITNAKAGHRSTHQA